MGGYRGINEGLSHRLEPRKRAFLVQTHEPAIASDIRREHAASRRSTLSPAKNAPKKSEIQPS